jgi:hypothetical protein
MPSNKEQAITRIAGDLKQTFSALSMSEAQQHAFMAEVFAKAVTPSPPLITYKQLWMDRADRKETARA